MIGRWKPLSIHAVDPLPMEWWAERREYRYLIRAEFYPWFIGPAEEHTICVKGAVTMFSRETGKRVRSDVLTKLVEETEQDEYALVLQGMFGDTNNDR